MILRRIFAYLLLALGLGPLAAQVFQASLTGSPSWIGLAAAFCLLALGLRLLVACYRRRPGIPVNPPWAAVFGDAVFSIALAAGGLGAVDAARVEILGLNPWMDDFALREVSAMMLLPAAGLFGTVTSMMGGQSVQAGPEGITLHGACAAGPAAWPDITGFTLRQIDIAAIRVGTPTKQKLQTALVVHAGEDEIIIWEPGTRAYKDRLIASLTLHAPPNLARELSNLAGRW